MEMIALFAVFTLCQTHGFNLVKENRTLVYYYPKNNGNSLGVLVEHEVFAYVHND